GQAIIDRDLVSIRSAATSKVEVIKELSEMAWAAGRVENAADLEEALWAREETFSTAIGFGFAVPHCKTDAVGTPMIALVKPATSIDWGSSDGEPVRVAIMLAIPAVAKEASRLHMELLARLARKLMHEKFRNRILSADRPESVVAALKSALRGD
ncbi:MAG: PTS sugar transporter subunit IIA, partial [Phycisphaerales bacterium]|nr:PTS sugar transporter subunit IIA [Phycisphaerales bacterium]